MRAWRLIAPGTAPTLDTLPDPDPTDGAVVVRMEAVPLLSYLREYAAGRLPYQIPPGPFVLGTNGVGTVEQIGRRVYHLSPGQRVFMSPFLTADEPVDEPVRVLTGLTGMGPASAPLLADWPDGTMAERVRAAASTVHSLDGVTGDASRLATLAKFVVPMGGLRRGRLRAGETLIVNGASGYFGSAGALLGVAMGAARVIVAGRDKRALEAVAAAAGPRATAVALSGDLAADVAALREASGGGAHMALDLVGRAKDTIATQASLKALRRGGRIVLMGSATEPMPLTYSEVLGNDWEIIGTFMYRPEDVRTLVALIRSGLLSLEAVRVTTFPIEALEPAMDAAASMRGLDCTVMVFDG